MRPAERLTNQMDKRCHRTIRTNHRQLEIEPLCAERRFEFFNESLQRIDGCRQEALKLA